MPTKAELQDLLERGFKPVPPDEEELAAIAEMQRGDYEIYSENITLIAQEGKEIMTKMGISSMLHSGDSMAALYTPQGDLVTAVCGTYLHVVTGQIPVKFILRYFKDNPTVGVREGDVFYCNEAIYGGIHNPDQFAIMPIFCDEELVAWTVVGAHQSETGGTEPGGEIVTAKTRHDEGLKLTPIKIGERYQLKDDLLLMMENFISRAPRMQVTDVKARVAACDRIRIRVQALVRKKGARFLKGLFRKMITQAAEGARERIRQWNDGTYRHTVFVDTTGTQDACLRVSLALHKRGDTLTLDFSGTSPEHEGSFHCLAPCLKGHCAVILYQQAFPEFPISAGMLDPIEWVIPEGTILNADHEAALSCAPITASVAFPLLGVCLSKMMFDSSQRLQICGMASANASAPMVSGVSQHGVRITDFMGYPLNAWGLPARCDQDGVDVWGFPHCPWGKAPDVEDIENEFPLLHLYQKQMTDTGGYGKYRGGVGAAIAYVVHQAPYLAFTSSQKESKMPTHTGVFGGYSETVIPGVRVVNSNIMELLARGERNIPADDYELLTNGIVEGEVVLEHMARGVRVVKQGDIITSSTQGGGGYGDVLERDPETVLQDVRDKYISRWTARHVYRVAFDEETLTLDRVGTERLRAETRAERQRLGKPYQEFVQEWAKIRPGPEVLKYFGEWPSARKNREVVRI